VNINVIGLGYGRKLQFLVVLSDYLISNQLSCFFKGKSPKASSGRYDACACSGI
jgi:hypothetical protein